MSRRKDEKAEDEFAPERIAGKPEGKREEGYARAAPPRTMEAPPRLLAAPRARDSEASKRYWEKIDDLFYNTVRTASRAFRTILSINLVIVVIGIAFVANSIAFTWLRPGTDTWTTSLISGGLGIASFVARFFVSPQENISKALGNLGQFQMICRKHSIELETIQDYDREKYEEPGARDIGEIAVMNRELERVTVNALDEIEQYVEGNFQAQVAGKPAAGGAGPG